MISSLFFDLDGTLCDTSQGIYGSLCYTARKFGVPPFSQKPCGRYIGPPLIKTLGEMVGADRADEALALYRDHYLNEKGVFNSPPFDGMREALTTLKAMGKRLFVTTAKFEDTGRLLLGHHDLAGFFEKIYGSFPDGSRSHKAEVIRAALVENNLSPDEVLMVGDHRFDMEGAAQNGLKAIGVAWGYGEVAELRATGASFIAQKPSDLPRLVEEL
jgi:phosphoglycolate phosphatase